MLEILQLLLPIIYGVIETVVLSQTYAYTSSALVEMLRFFILAVSDTFVALDCFPLPLCAVSHVANEIKCLMVSAHPCLFITLLPIFKNMRIILLKLQVQAIHVIALYRPWI